MGMFDTISSSLEIYGCPWDHDLQTKSFDSLMNHYWISPAGELFQVDYAHTHDWIEVPLKERRGLFGRYRTIANGNHGRVYPVAYWGHVHVIPTHYPKAKDWKTLIFERGVVTAIESDTTISPGILTRADNRRRAP